MKVAQYINIKIIGEHSCICNIYTALLLNLNSSVAYVNAIDAPVVVPVQLHVKQLIIGRVVAARRPSVATVMREHRRARGCRGGGAHHNPLTRASGDESRRPKGNRNEIIKSRSFTVRREPRSLRAVYYMRSTR